MPHETTINEQFPPCSNYINKALLLEACDVILKISKQFWE
jgi:hypothetical protein